MIVENGPGLLIMMMMMLLMIMIMIEKDGRAEIRARKRLEEEVVGGRK